MRLLGYPLAELEALLRGWGEPAYRARQLFEWLHRHNELRFSCMTSLPGPLRARLEADFGTDRPTVLDHTGDDDARKLLIGLADGERVESVLMGRPWGQAACVSSQVGCPVGCVFCASGRDGLARNLAAGEIVGQLSILRAMAGPIRRVVFMGMGEPLLNLEESLTAARIITDRNGWALPTRNLTFSTIGIVRGIRALAGSGDRFRLALSLHAADDTLRRELVPRWSEPLRDVLRAGTEYAEAVGRRLTVAYVLLGGVNDSTLDARSLAALVGPARALVNVIPFNPVPGTSFERPTPARVAKFVACLHEAGIRASARRSVGLASEAACGQLRRRAARCAEADDRCTDAQTKEDDR
ncbi:MAG TPA: 23S rRNA (adenine(2503)-C(2))-methyltransferase RlmN [Armatimonadota bacterium]|nr:23S rRNA (adenine(2503)-C(2))-methyltransferase RlmN [Armatimonadota bacterium]